MPSLTQWRVTPESLSVLDRTDGRPPGSVSLHVTGLTPEVHDRLAGFLVAHGDLLRVLKIRQDDAHLDWTAPRGDLTAVDFATHCPHLTRLDAERITVTGSVFTHPTLTHLRLERCSQVGRDPITVGDSDAPGGRDLTKIEIVDCVIEADRFTVGPTARLRDFSFSLDEDDAVDCPDDFAFHGPRLTRIYLNACWGYTVTMGGLPSGVRTHFAAGQYGSVTFV